MGDETEINVAVQRYWEQREYVEVLSWNMSKIVGILNQFEATTRTRLSKINDRLRTLETTVEYLDKLLSSNEASPEPAL